MLTKPELARIADKAADLTTAAGGTAREAAEAAQASKLAAAIFADFF